MTLSGRACPGRPGLAARGTSIFAVLLGLSGGPWVNAASAQSCTSLPHHPSELWLGTGILTEGNATWEEVAVEAAPGDRFGISLRRSTGSREEDRGMEAWGGRVGIPFGSPAARFCIFGGFELNDFSFEGRYDMDRGDADYLTREMGLRVEIPVLEGGGIEMTAWLAPVISHLRWEVSGRTLIVGDQISAEERKLGGEGWRFSGGTGLSLRWRFLGVSGGVTRRPSLSSDLLVFGRVGVALIRNAG